MIDRTPYPRDAGVDPTLYRFEAQLWDRQGYDPEGVTFRSFTDALEFVAT